MLKFLSSLFFLMGSLLCNASLAADDLSAATDNVNVGGGSDAAFGSHPHVAAIFLSPEYVRTASTTERDDDGKEPFCTGFLVDPSFVLTAAHCVTDLRGFMKPGDLDVAVGRTDVKRPMQGIRSAVDGIFAHPSLDAVLLRLQSPVSPSSVIALASAAPSIGESLGLAGYGVIDAAGTLKPVLQVGNTERVSCPAGHDIPDSHVCYKGAQSTCPGDSGSAVTVLRNGTKEAAILHNASLDLDNEAEQNEFFNCRAYPEQVGIGIAVHTIRSWVFQTMAKHSAKTVFPLVYTDFLKSTKIEIANPFDEDVHYIVRKRFDNGGGIQYAPKLLEKHGHTVLSLSNIAVNASAVTVEIWIKGTESGLPAIAVSESNSHIGNALGMYTGLRSPSNHVGSFRAGDANLFTRTPGLAVVHANRDWQSYVHVYNPNDEAILVLAKYRGFARYDQEFLKSQVINAKGTLRLRVGEFATSDTAGTLHVEATSADGTDKVLPVYIVHEQTDGVQLLQTAMHQNSAGNHMVTSLLQNGNSGWVSALAMVGTAPLAETVEGTFWGPSGLTTNQNFPSLSETNLGASNFPIPTGHDDNNGPDPRAVVACRLESATYFTVTANQLLDSTVSPGGSAYNLVNAGLAAYHAVIPKWQWQSGISSGLSIVPAIPGKPVNAIIKFYDSSGELKKSVNYYSNQSPIGIFLSGGDLPTDGSVHIVSSNDSPFVASYNRVDTANFTRDVIGTTVVPN